jgi:hypothetical protein
VKEAATTISNASSASTVSSRSPKGAGFLCPWLLWIQLATPITSAQFPAGTIVIEEMARASKRLSSWEM